MTRDDGMDAGVPTWTELREENERLKDEVAALKRGVSPTGRPARSAPGEPLPGRTFRDGNDIVTTLYSLDMADIEQRVRAYFDGEMADAAVNLAGQIKTLQEDNERLREALRTVRDHAKAGVCCCGEAMDGHSAVPDHIPRDYLDYFIAGQLGEEQ